MAAASLPQPADGPEGHGVRGALPATIQVVEFLLGNERFAIDLFDVKEVVEYTPVTKIPRVPPSIRGIIDLRGEVITIIDLKQRLNITGRESNSAEASRIIVLDSRITRKRTGILVDDVTSVSTFESSRVDNTSASVSDDTAIIGIIKRAVRVRDRDTSELIIWIDIRKLIVDMDNGR